jgi:hypothetical protein
MNITLSADEKIIEHARKAAQAMGNNLNQAVRDYQEQFAADEEGLDPHYQQSCPPCPTDPPGGQP